MTEFNFENLTYCGKEASEIMSKDIYTLDLRGYGITLMDGVKGKQKIYSGDMGEVFQPYTCPFTPNGEVVLSEDFIEPAAIKVNLEQCYDSFWNTWLVEQTSITLDGGIPATFSEWFFDRLRKEMSKEYQELFWRGDTSETGDTYMSVVDGVETQLEANSGVTKITGSTFTVNNIIAQVEAVVMDGLDKAATDGANTDSYKIFMNKNDVRLLMIALGKDCSCNLTNSAFKNYAMNGDRLIVMGFEVIPSELSRNSIVFGPAANLVLGFDTFDSHLEYRLINMKETTGDNAFRVIAISNIAVGIIYPELFIYSRP